MAPPTLDAPRAHLPAIHYRVRTNPVTRSQMFTAARMELEYPMSLGVYDDYLKAQHVVDYLADQAFPVQNVEIVGTELRSVERVTGRLTRGKLAAAGALSGLWIGLFVGIAFSLFGGHNQLGFLITTPILGALFGLVWSQVGYATATRRGTRDFASVNQILATKYEVLVEHKHAADARQLLAAMPYQ